MGKKDPDFINEILFSKEEKSKTLEIQEAENSSKDRMECSDKTRDSRIELKKGILRNKLRVDKSNSNFKICNNWIGTITKLYFRQLEHGNFVVPSILLIS